ncbi:MAG: hypothetical protein KCHDKBKB_03090 [Elusimicrobia bacterium]|nr:hypothetical protein [Elusimicrobiota bacterium]
MQSLPFAHRDPAFPSKCPKCRLRLQETKCGDVWLDQCRWCLGLWFDAKELDQVKSEFDESIRWIDVALWKYAEKANFNASSVDCPRCCTLMSELRFDSSSVILEFCINCAGAWFDHGEHKAIVDFLRERATAYTADDLKRISLQQLKQIFDGPKGVVDEIKDFVASWRMLSLRFAVEHPKLVERINRMRRSLPF